MKRGRLIGLVVGMLCLWGVHAFAEKESRERNIHGLWDVRRISPSSFIRRKAAIP